jgi:hypothetical protein
MDAAQSDATYVPVAEDIMLSREAVVLLGLTLRRRGRQVIDMILARQQLVMQLLRDVHDAVFLATGGLAGGSSSCVALRRPVL